MLAEEHGVLAHLATRLNACEGSIMPVEVRERMQERRRLQLAHTLRLTAELFRVVEMLKKEGLEIPVVKGPVLSARAYGDAGTRQYGDLDLLVRHEEVGRVTKLMEAAGYEPVVPLAAIEAGKIPGQYLFLRPEARLVVEFHTQYTLRYFPRSLPIEEFYRRKTEVEIDGHRVPALAAEDEFVLICIHGAKHFWERLIWIADVAAMAAQKNKLDWRRVAESAAQVGATRMVHAGLYLAAEVLRTPTPMELSDAKGKDAGLLGISRKVQGWLPAAGSAPPGLFERAAFRMAMQGGGISGARYLLRLAFSPTEEDWREGTETHGARVWEALRRPLRLAKKYRRGGG
jgi:Uncharacterised nucleotidyltransferase